MIDFNKLIDNFLFKEYKPKSIGRYYPSEIAGCMRKTWFSYKIPKQTDAKLFRIFESGNMLHEFITEAIKSEKNKEVELIKSEMPVKIKSKNFVVSGRVDNLVLVRMCEKNKCKEVLVEVKSAKFLPKEKRKEHEMQLQLYLKACKHEDGIILYIQKDNLETRAFNVRYNKVLAGKIMRRFQLLHKSLVENKMPPPEARNNADMSWMCEYCAWRGECRRG